MYLVPIGSGLGEIRGLIFLRECLPWFHGTRLRDTFHGTTGSIERWQDSGGSRCRRSCHSKNRGHAGRCSASAPTGFASVRLVIFSDATRATAGSTREITYGLRITRGRCYSRCKIKCNSADRSVGRAPMARAKLGQGAKSSSHRADAWRRCADDPVNRSRRSTPRLLFSDEEADLGVQATMMDCGC